MSTSATTRASSTVPSSAEVAIAEVTDAITPPVLPGAGGKRTRVRRHGPISPLGRVLIYVMLTVLTAIIFVPFFWMVSSSLKQNNEVFSIPVQWIPTEFVWQNYVDIWTRIPMLTYLKNSLFLSVTITILQVLTGSFAAYGFSKMHFKGRDVLFVAYIATIAVASWPFLLLCSLPLGPAFAAGCWSFQRSRDAADAGPLREVGIGLLRTWRAALAVWSLVCALTFVVVIDIVAVWGTPFAMLLGPLLVVVLLLAVVAAFGVFAGLAAAPGLRFRAQLLGGLVRTVRRPGTSLLSLVLLAAWALIVLAQPVLGLLALGGFVLYAVWSNAAAALAD